MALAPDYREWRRFWTKVLIGDGCWEWQAAKDPNGYGRFHLGGRKGNARLAHRVAYEDCVGPIPEGLTLDHLCRNTSCVNPSHLEPVTNRENILRGTAPSALHARKTHCPRGHPYDEANTMRRKAGNRRCRICVLEQNRAGVARRRANQED